MAWKHILVHLDPTARCRTRLQLAVDLARRHQARLTGVFARLAQPERIGVVIDWPPPAYVAAATASKALFTELAGSLPEAEWRDANRGSATEVCTRVAHLARYADLVVMGQYDPRDVDVVPEFLAEEVVVDSGRPVLILPYAGDFPDIGQHPLVAWTDTREAARALHDALPLIADSKQAFLFSIAAQAEDAQAACTEVARILAARGIESRIDAFSMKDNEGLGVMDMVLNRISDRSADLLVIGGHAAQSGLFSGRRGSGTRHILAHMTVPVLMSN